MSIVVWWTVFSSYAQSYTVASGVPDFMDITASCVVATHGTNGDPFVFQGILPNRHELIQRQGTDPNTGDRLKFLPPGEDRVIRLGNDSVGGQAESITYHFKVDPEKAVLLLKFAVVFQDPGHESKDQPRFVVRIMNKEGDLIESCAEYDVTARPGIEGFQTFSMGSVPVQWRDWTSVGLDMSLYAGKEVQVQFVTYDCALMGHFGYAYFTAQCISGHLNLTACEGDQFTVSAPEGFAAYRWQDGRTTFSTDWVRTSEEMALSCEVTSATGCRFTLSAWVSNSSSLPTDTVFYDTICQGEAYDRYRYHLAPREEAGSFRYENTYFDLNNCRDDGRTILYLTVLQRYYPIEARICEGESYTEHGFSYHRTSPGEIYDTLRYVRSSGCDSIVVLHLTVFPVVTMTSGITGEQHPCVGSVQYYSMQENWPEGSYSWQFPEGYTLIEGQGTTRVTVQITDVAEAGQVYLLYGTGSCAMGTEPLRVTPVPSYWLSLVDSICTGQAYEKQGFHIAPSDRPEMLSVIQRLKTVAGCDSILTLSLYVMQTPEIHVLSSKQVLCEGDSLQLEVMAGEAQWVNPPVPEIAVGDILCKDGKLVKSTDYDPDRQEAEGVVFWVDGSGEHGWAVALQDESSPENNLFCWLNPNYWGDVPGIKNYYISKDAIKDTCGYQNTEAMRNMGNDYYFPIAWNIDYQHGWYIPAAGQLTHLFSVLYDVNESLATVNGQPLKTELTRYSRYWSSTESSSKEAWNLALWLGFISTNSKSDYYGVRTVKSF